VTSLLVERLAEQKGFQTRFKSSKRVAVSDSTWERVPGGRSWAASIHKSSTSVSCRPRRCVDSADNSTLHSSAIGSCWYSKV